MSMVRVAPGALVIGSPLPWPVFDADGNLLLQEGYVIHNELQLEQLFARGLFVPRAGDLPAKKEEPVSDVRARNPFSDYPDLRERVAACYQAISNKADSAPERVLGLARLVDRTCLEAPDPALALVHLFSIQPDARDQMLGLAILCHFIAMGVGIDAKSRQQLMAASLVANLALLPVLEKLNQARHHLETPQRSLIEQHPLRSVALLREAGLQEEKVLNIIAQHHERVDGQGYPAQLRGEQILLEARILNLAESYLSLISKRGYRERTRMSARDAMLRLRSQAEPNQQPPIHEALMQMLTPYPPGVLVRLANEEVAVITERVSRRSGAIAQAVIGSKGNRYLGSLKRNSREAPAFQIKEEVIDLELPGLDYNQLWGFV